MRCIACNAKLSDHAPIEETLCRRCLVIAKNPNRVKDRDYQFESVTNEWVFVDKDANNTEDC